VNARFKRAAVNLAEIVPEIRGEASGSLLGDPDNRVNLHGRRGCNPLRYIDRLLTRSARIRAPEFCLVRFPSLSFLPFLHSCRERDETSED